MTNDSNVISAARLDFTRLLMPSAVALVGASSNPHAVGGQPLHYMKAFGYRGKLYPVNPKRSEVQGIKCYDNVLSIPDRCDVAVVAVSASHVPNVIRECGKVGIPYAVILSAGFDTIDSGSAGSYQELRDAIVESGVRVIGPNCTGVVSLKGRACLAFGGILSDLDPVSGSVAMISQSGGVGLSVLDAVQRAGVGTNYFVSSGGEIDLNIFDFVDSFLDDPDVSVIALYLESTTNGRRLREVGRRALQMGKPIVVLKTGNTGVAHKAAESHTSRLTARYELFQTAFREGGYIEVAEIDELADVVKALRAKVLPKGKRTAILSSSGGWGVMMAERCEQHGLIIPAPARETTVKLRELAPTYASLGNPIDMTPQGYSDHYAAYNQIAKHLLSDPGFDLLAVRSPTGSDVKVWSEGIQEIAEQSKKFVLVNWAPALNRYMEVKTFLEDHGIPCLSYAKPLARVAAACVEFSAKRNKGTLDAASGKRSQARKKLSLRKTPGGMAEGASKKCLQAYGISTTKELLVTLDEIDSLQTHDLKYPLAVKIESADVLHKTEAGGVLLNIQNLEQVKRAARSVVDHVRRYAPTATIDGILIQEMATGTEMILGAASDPDFGPYVMCGLGGIFTEILHDVAYRFAPITNEHALEMLDELKGHEVLAGARGRLPLDQTVLAETIVKLSCLVADYESEIAEIEINPLFVGNEGAGVIAADCIITVR